MWIFLMLKLMQFQGAYNESIPLKKMNTTDNDFPIHMKCVWECLAWTKTATLPCIEREKNKKLFTQKSKQLSNYVNEH